MNSPMSTPNTYFCTIFTLAYFYILLTFLWSISKILMPHLHTRGNLQCATNLLKNTLRCGKTLEHPADTHKATGRKCKLQMAPKVKSERRSVEQRQELNSVCHCAAQLHHYPYLHHDYPRTLEDRYCTILLSRNCH